MAINDKYKSEKKQEKIEMKKNTTASKRIATKNLSLDGKAKKKPIKKKINKLMEKNRKTLEKKLDKIFSIYIRLRDRVDSDHIRCVSCKKLVHWKEAHNCHYIGRGNRLFRWNVTNCHAGCAGCNTYNQEFHMAEYTIFMIDKYNRYHIDYLRDNRHTLKKRSLDELSGMIDKYGEEVNKMMFDL